MTDVTQGSTLNTVMKGKAWTFGDNVPTDQIVPTYIVFAPMAEVLKHVLEELKPEFPKSVKPGDIILAGAHFGQSSGRAVAAKSIQAAGVSCIVAESFARTFLRNCYEIGLPIVECPGIGAAATDGDEISIDLVAGRVRNETRGTEFECRPIEPFLLKMLEAGGLIPLVKAGGAEWRSTQGD